MNCLWGWGSLRACVCVCVCVCMFCLFSKDTQLIKSDKTFVMLQTCLFQINSVILNFLFIKES